MNIMTEKEKSLTIKNVVLACKNIEKLNKRGYDFLYLANGFIAHYNKTGFIDYYSHNDLRDDILSNSSNNQYRNFSPSDHDYGYYMGKKEVFNAICEAIA